MPRRKRLETDAALDERALERRLKAFRQWIARRMVLQAAPGFPAPRRSGGL